MRSLVIIAILSISFVSASPIATFNVRALEATEVVTITVSTTVTVGAAFITPDVQPPPDISDLNTDPNLEPFSPTEPSNPPNLINHGIQSNLDGSNILDSANVEPNVGNEITPNTSDVQPITEPMINPEEKNNNQVAPELRIFKSVADIIPAPEIGIAPSESEAQPILEVTNAEPNQTLEPAPPEEVVIAEEPVPAEAKALVTVEAPSPFEEQIPAEVEVSAPVEEPAPAEAEAPAPVEEPISIEEPVPAKELVPETEVTPVSSPTQPKEKPSLSSDGPQGGDTPLTNYQSSALFHHNIHRANHTASDLTWNSTLADFALITAKKCIFAHDLTPGDGRYGQNLASFGSSRGVESLEKSDVVAFSITNQWYNDEFDFVTFGAARPSTRGPEFLHFTQTVWRDTQTVGCATVECRGGSLFRFPSYFTVCNYFPAGNILGEFDTEVSEPLGMDLVTNDIS
ncbi:hypothetical protein K3495_g10755 [Podosphaera aphanis]|nr:hypothetical protein K3495_g10755 [Podosphaera aphanis]